MVLKTQTNNLEKLMGLGFIEFSKSHTSMPHSVLIYDFNVSEFLLV